MCKRFCYWFCEYNSIYYIKTSVLLPFCSLPIYLIIQLVTNNRKIIIFVWMNVHQINRCKYFGSKKLCIFLLSTHSIFQLQLTCYENPCRFKKCVVFTQLYDITNMYLKNLWCQNPEKQYKFGWLLANTSIIYDLIKIFLYKFKNVTKLIYEIYSMLHIYVDNVKRTYFTSCLLCIIKALRKICLKVLQKRYM